MIQKQVFLAAPHVFLFTEKLPEGLDSNVTLVVLVRLAPLAVSVKKGTN